MGRKERREQKSFLQRKLTDEQFEFFKGEVIDEAVKQRLIKQWDILSVAFVKILRANKLSELRTLKILNEMNAAVDAIASKRGAKDGET